MPLRSKIHGKFSLFKNCLKTAMKKASESASCKHIATDSGASFAKPLQKNGAFTTLPTPTKSASDPKEYKVIQLQNGLIACLIADKRSNFVEMETTEDSDEEMLDADQSDLESEEGSEADSEDDGSESNEESDSACEKNNKRKVKLAAAGLSVGVGSFSDPKDVPGMAHFLEHMVFMGSEKYPQENFFDKFIQQSGGSNNATTDAEHTVFYFECLEKHFEEALDRFSQFFKAPLMKRDAMARETEAIDSEFQLAVPSDSWRMQQLLFSLAQKDSPVNSFSWGNFITLKQNVDQNYLYEQAHAFRHRHYSAHRMTLTVQACLPMEQLQQYVLDHFSEIPNNDLPPIQFTEFRSVFNTPEFNKLYYVIPMKDFCQVEITWAFPSLLKKYRSGPQNIISNLIGDEGKGSLLSHLKKFHWAVSTCAGTEDTESEHNSIYTLFKLEVSLTEEGYSHINEVIAIIFSYLRLLREHGIERRIFEEMQKIASISFKYADEESAIDCVSEMCSNMQVFPPEDYITGSVLLVEYDPELIQMLLEEMVPEKANIMLLKKQSQNTIDNDYQTEKWFGTKYCVQDIPEEWMHQWKNCPLLPELSLPAPNTFITSDFALLPDISNNSEYPRKVMDSPLVELWYRRDMHFKLPVAHYYFQLISSLSLYDCKSICMLDAFIALLTIELSEELYPAVAANLSYALESYEGDLLIKVWGFNQKLPHLLGIIVKYINDLSDRVNQSLFDAIKDKRLKCYYNMSLKPSVLAKELRLNLLVDKQWDSIERYNAMLGVSYDDIITFAKNYFKSVYVKVLVQGNVSETSAISTVKEFINELGYSELPKELLPKYHVVRLEKGEKCCRAKNICKSDTNSVVTNYYQSDHFTIQNSAMLDIIMMLIEEPLFDTLRTKEQLGYQVYCSCRDTFGVLGFSITVFSQVTKATTKFIDARIEAFMNHIHKLMMFFNDESFQLVKDNLIKKKQCNDNYLKEEVDRNWDEILNNEYVFDRIKQEIKAIEQVTCYEMRSWWDAHHSYGNREKFRKISIQVEGHAHSSCQINELKIDLYCNEDEALSKDIENYFITNIKEYKDSLEVYHVKSK
ncbi:nardilysin isoform X1 [Dendroctonus ponderosae]|nr:nardilysin isoform X1 [Dendroctonus ponderosae]KAH1009982.1 hypothetical protein HUJ05_004347 [Dendroctonus ponderosae]